MRFAITLGQLNPAFWADACLAADECGYESVWLPEHLVLPVQMAGQLVPGEEHAPIPASTPVFDAVAWLAWMAAQTRSLRLGTFVYLLGIRHPFVGARAFATLDVLSQGRAEVGVGAGWLTTEWEAVGLDPSARGPRLDEAIDVCRRLWTEDVIAHDGPAFPFDEVMFEPKPVQRPHPPISIGGESGRALRRAAVRGDGWLGMFHDPASAAAQVERLRGFERDLRTFDAPVDVTVMGQVRTPADVEAFAAAGVDRLIVVPWTRSPDAVHDLRAFASSFDLAAARA